MISADEIFDGFIGGGKPSENYIRKEVVLFEDLIISSEIDRKMTRLLSLHPQLRVEFRTKDLSNLDEKTKEALLQDMYDILGVTPLSNE
ncbi:MAG TPA: hypothetical protein VGO50_15880 [Pyrinomonadaceae bacterium]|jgi:hypothetical protein|nr:hypothetical protein [Pyrinomonadaceae bacterium]